jgi:geranylgeranyl diphosphate synthase type I
LKDPIILNKYKSFINDELKFIILNEKNDQFSKFIFPYIIPKQDSNIPKRVRSSIFLEIIEGFNLNSSEFLGLACSIELIHEFSLIHDDIQDKDEIRRGAPTLWKKLGEYKSIILGNVIKNISDTITNIDNSNKLTNKSRIEIIKQFSNMCISMIEGQYLDINYENQQIISINNYKNMIIKKTGALMTLAFQLPSIVSGQNIESVKQLQKLGIIFGILFQISDDMLGIWGNPIKTGKSNYSDLRNNKKTYPILLSMKKFKKEDKILFNNLLSNLNKTSYLSIIEILEKYRIKSDIQKECNSYLDEAIKLINTSKLTKDSKANIIELFKYVIERTK